MAQYEHARDEEATISCSMKITIAMYGMELLFIALLVITKVVDATSKPTEREVHTINMIQSVENVFKQVEREQQFELLC